MTKLLNKTAVITGAAQGLGKEISRSLARDGFNIVINYNKSKKDAEILEKELSVLTKTLTVKGDVSKFSNAQDVIKKSKKKFGRIDVLVNNAGIHIDSTVTKMTVNAWNDVINTNLGGVFNFTKAVIPIMKKQNYGRIINISSFTAFRGIVGASNYAASKAGIAGFTKSFAKEVAKQMCDVDIRVEIDDRAETINRKVREAQLKHINYILVVGDNEVKNKTVTVRTRDEKVHGEKKIADIIKSE